MPSADGARCKQLGCGQQHSLVGKQRSGSLPLRLARLIACLRGMCERLVAVPILTDEQNACSQLGRPKILAATMHCNVYSLHGM